MTASSAVSGPGYCRGLGRASPSESLDEVSAKRCLAVDCGASGGARFGEPGGMQFADLVDQIGFGDDPEVVEARDAVSGHSVIGAQPQLSGDVSDGSGHGSSEDAVEDGDRCGSSHDQKWAAANALDFAPPDLSSVRRGHHGSSRIASRSEAVAASSSLAVGGFRV